MPYEKANRDLTDEQFSEGTTIDGSRIDKAIEDIIDTQNSIPNKNTEALWTPTTYVMCFAPARPFHRFQRNLIEGPAAPYGRCGLNRSMQTQNHLFPFLSSHNTEFTTFPYVEQPTLGINNEYRNKGFFYNPPEDAFDSTQYGSVAWGDVNNSNNTLPPNKVSGVLSPAGAGNGTSWQQKKYFTCMFPFYFNKPVIIMDVSVFAAQEHPTSFFNGQERIVALKYYDLGPDGYKDPALPMIAAQKYYPAFANAPPTPNSIESVEEGLFSATVPVGTDGTLPSATGFEFPGELYTFSQQNIGCGTIQISIDNPMHSEKRELNNVVFNKTKLGDTAHRFNQFHTTNNTAGHAVPLSGGEYVDMTPEYPGGSTWGVWIREENLNIPIPRDSRVRFSVINKGFRAGQLFEWNCALTVLERVED